MLRDRLARPTSLPMSQAEAVSRSCCGAPVPGGVRTCRCGDINSCSCSQLVIKALRVGDHAAAKHDPEPAIVRLCRCGCLDCKCNSPELLQQHPSTSSRSQFSQHSSAGSRTPSAAAGWHNRRQPSCYPSPAAHGGPPSGKEGGRWRGGGCRDVTSTSSSSPYLWSHFHPWPALTPA
ncbi:hypothetical protein HaLaN_08611 [Haematococcus lacustris]|uniref:Uncharacterized protein n=1 Tax=Haematococcus lacustris TaxID=44745 RepID=A0A699YZL2_HAELA|nr:hypothetical protein HaLaN_08611 [Haematococcus lacustris]